MILRVLFLVLFHLLGLVIIPAGAQGTPLEGKWILASMKVTGEAAKEFQNFWNPEKDFFSLQINADSTFKAYQYKTLKEGRWETTDEGKLLIIKNSFFFKSFTEFRHSINGRITSSYSHCGSGEFYCHPSFMEPWEHSPYIFRRRREKLLVTFSGVGPKIQWVFKKTNER